MSTAGRPLAGASDVDLQLLERGATTPDHFRSPQFVTQDGQEAVFKIADGAKQIFGIRGLVSVDAALGKAAFESRVALHQGVAGAYAERGVGEAFAEGGEMLRLGRGDQQDVIVGLEKGDAVLGAIVANPADMCEEVEGAGFGGGQRRAAAPTRLVLRRAQ